MDNNENSATEKEKKSIPRWRSQTQCFSVREEYTDMDDSTSEEMLGVAEEKITLTHEKLAEELNNFEIKKHTTEDDDTDDVTSDTEEYSDFMEARPEEMFLTPDDSSEIISSNTTLSLNEKIRQVSQIPTQALMMEEDLGIKVVKREKASTKKISNEEILELILQGETIKDQNIDCLDLREQEFDNPIQLIHCEIGEILAEGSDFNSSFTLENCSIQGDFNFGGDGISLIKGLLTLKDVEVQGNLNWSKATFSKKMHIVDCDFAQVLNLTEVSLENGCIISNCHIPTILLPNSYIAGTFIIKDTTIAKTFNLSNSQILGLFNADSTTFSQWNCFNSHFQNKVEFSKCTFEKSSVFEEMQVNESLTIEKCILDSVIQFTKAHIKENFFCIKSQFNKNVDFTQMVVYRHIIFDNIIFKTYVGFSNANVNSIKILHTIFQGIATFQATTFLSDVSFIDVSFENNVYFNRAIIYQKANFQETKFNKSISLSNIIGDYIRFSKEQVKGKLLAEVANDRNSLQNEYNTLERLFQKQGDYKARDWAHYNALRLERKSRKFSLNPFKICSRLGNYLFLDICSGYGTKPKNVVWFSIVLIVLFGILYTGLDIAYPKDTSKIQNPESKKQALLENLSNSIFMPVSCFAQEDRETNNKTESKTSPKTTSSNKIIKKDPKQNVETKKGTTKKTETKKGTTKKPETKNTPKEDKESNQSNKPKEKAPEPQQPQQQEQVPTFGIPEPKEKFPFDSPIMEDITPSINSDIENNSNIGENQTENDAPKEDIPNQPNVFSRYYTIVENKVIGWWNTGYKYVSGKLEALKEAELWKKYKGNIQKGFTRSCRDFFPMDFEFTKDNTLDNTKDNTFYFLDWIERLCGLFCIFSLLIAILHTKFRL